MIHVYVKKELVRMIVYYVTAVGDGTILLASRSPPKCLNAFKTARKIIIAHHALKPDQIKTEFHGATWME